MCLYFIQFHEAEKMRDYDMLRQVQGMYAPLHLEMERVIASKVFCVILLLIILHQVVF